MPSPLISIIILNWNGSACLRECLESVVKTTYPNFEIIVVDNASTDGSAEIVQQFSTVLLLRLPENIGFAAGNNVGFKKARGTYIATLNNDVEVDPLWLQHAVDVFDKDSSIGIIACRQMKYQNRTFIDTLYTYPLKSLLFAPMGVGQRYENKKLFSQPGYVLGAAGASALYRKEVIEQFGGFDIRYYAYHEETDLCMRAFLSGWKCAYSPRSIVYHRGSLSFNTVQNKMVYYHERNRIFFIYKFFPTGFIIKNIFWIIAWQMRVARVWVLKRKIGGIFFSALLDGWKSRALFREERKNYIVKFRAHRRQFEEFVDRKLIPF